MAPKKISRAIHGTCVVVGTDGEADAAGLPSKVRVTVQRPRGGCLCLGKKSRQVAVFTFDARPNTYHRSYALLDLEKLFKYSSKENTQIKICVEQRHGGKRVSRVPLEEFLQQLLSTGPSQWFFLYIYEGHVSLCPSSHSNREDVPKWAFEGTSCHKQELKITRVNTEEDCTIVDDVINRTMNDILEAVFKRVQNKEEQCTEECVNEQTTEEECVNEQTEEECVTKQTTKQCITEQAVEQCVIEEVTLPEDNITGQEDALSDKNMNDEESDDEWVTEEDSSENGDEEKHNDEGHITDNKMTNEEEIMAMENNDLQHETEDLRIPWTRLLKSLSHGVVKGVVIFACSVNMVAVFYDILRWTLGDELGHASSPTIGLLRDHGTSTTGLF